MSSGNLAATLDDIDRRIVDLLVEDGRRSATDIAERVSLSLAPVKRRMDRLERDGVIVGYTAVVDSARLGAGFETFAEIRLLGNAPVDEFIDQVLAFDEVLELFTIAGDPDVLLRLRVGDLHHLQDVIGRVRAVAGVTGTKTLMVLSTLRGHPSRTPARGQPTRKAPPRAP